ncbi:MAG: hypothetical protein NTV63_03620 [Candidatus Woesearchaeota archaeon]|nr:hypothetical protein [Candidatus Woesearchaeota archaeon]
MSSDAYQKILEFVKINGPTLPSEAAKCINSTILLSSAILSDLVSQKQIRISHAKIGGSPVYYLSGQEDKLERLYPLLNEKDRQTYDMLKFHHVIEDSSSDPLTRVSLRTLKDFAIPMTVKSSENDAERIFWRWHLLSDNEANSEIKSILESAEKRAKAHEKRIEKPAEKPKGISEFIQEKIFREEKTEKEEKKESKPEKAPEIQEEQKEISPIEAKEPFLSEVIKFFSSNKVEIIEKSIQKKKSEYDFVIRIPSNVGSLSYFCRARKKASINEEDLSSAYVQAGIRKLPCLFITSGKLTKKASEILSREFKNMTFKNL